MVARNFGKCYEKRKSLTTVLLSAILFSKDLAPARIALICVIRCDHVETTDDMRRYALWLLGSSSTCMCSGPRFEW